MAQAEAHRKAAFTYHPSLSPFAVPPQEYLAKHADPRYSYIATGTVVFDNSAPEEPRVLLLQRSSGDSMPDRWEIPGGGCDDDDESILYGAARELWEEAGLEATYIASQVGEGEMFTSRSGKKICKFTFVVETKHNGRPQVKLDPNEHQQYVWATKKEVKENIAGDRKLEFTTPDLEKAVLASFCMIPTGNLVAKTG